MGKGTRGRRGAVRGKGVNKSRGSTASELDQAEVLRLQIYPDRQPDSYPESEDENSRDAPVEARNTHAGKTLLINKKRKEAAEPQAANHPLAQKKPRNCQTVVPETVIPETEDPIRREEHVPIPQSGAVIAKTSSADNGVEQGLMTGAFLKSFVSRVIGQFAGNISSDLGEVNKNLGRLVSQVADLEKEVVELRAAASCNGAIASKGSSGEKGLKAWKRLLDVETPYINIGFDNLVQSKVLTKCACRLFVMNLGGDVGRLTNQAARSLMALMFGLQKNKLKSSYSEGEGKMHADFRYMFILSMVYHVQRNVSAQFDTDNHTLSLNIPSQNTATHSEQVPKLSDSSYGRVSSNHATAKVKNRPTQPKWLQPGFIKVEDIKKARSHAEATNSAKEKVVRQAPTVRDIALHGCRKLYTLVTSSFHRRRAGARVQFFEDLGYLAVDWSTLNTRLEKKSMSVSWAHEEGKDFDRTLSSVPNARKCDIHDDTTREWNNKMWAEFRDEARDMIIFVSHDVVVVSGDNVSKSKDRGTVRPFRRALNLMEVAAGFLVRYVQLASIEELLGVCEESVKAIFVVAVAFRTFVQHLVWDPLAELCSIKCDILPVDRLLPPPSVQERSASSRLLRMTQTQYDLLNLPHSATLKRSNASAPDPAEESSSPNDWGQEIDPSQILDLCVL